MTQAPKQIHAETIGDIPYNAYVLYYIPCKSVAFIAKYTTAMDTNVTPFLAAPDTNIVCTAIADYSCIRV